MLVARAPLLPIPMAAAQRPPRRTSARFQETGDVVEPSRSAQVNRPARTTANGQGIAPAKLSTSNDRKRKMNYDEEDDGFMFKRVKKKPEPKPVETKAAEPQPTVTGTRNDAPSQVKSKVDEDVAPQDNQTTTKPKPQRKRLSFSTPKAQAAPPRRRSKRLSKDNEENIASPAKKPSQKEQPQPRTEHQAPIPTEKSPQKRKRTKEHSENERRSQATAEEDVHHMEVDRHTSQTIQEDEQTQTIPTHQDNHSATKIALPLADTPVINRNKELRRGTAKGERRSSLGSRGRRASSLIESGNSSALPHTEVDVTDYYKHIESEGLPEPRRMKQLLIWCAERALDEKPSGTDFADTSARHSARVIEEELLKELSSRSDLSDWFAREDAPAPRKPLPERPNPRNVQNMGKLAELEEQIQRLRMEKEALEAVLKPASLPMSRQENSRDDIPDRLLLSREEAAALDAMNSNASTSSDRLSEQMSTIINTIGPTIDRFADGIHRLGQYRTAADNLAGRALAICAQKLAERDKEGRRRALLPDEKVQQDTPPKDLGGILRSLSRADR